MTPSLPGLPPGAVYLSDYRQDWPDLFAKEAARLQVALGPSALGIEHYGSTAIPGLAAKPVTDILIGIPGLDHGLDLVPAMERLGYDFSPDAGVAGHLVFGLGRNRTHLAHLVQFEGDAWTRCLRFRDQLRYDPELSQSYRLLKTRLATEFPGNRGAYTAGKSDFVETVLRMSPKT